MRDTRWVWEPYELDSELLWGGWKEAGAAASGVDSVEVYGEAMARLFEGMILLALGYQERVEDTESPGEVADFRVTAKRPEVQLFVDKNRPETRMTKTAPKADPSPRLAPWP